MEKLSGFDYGVIAAYMLAVLAVGQVLRRRAAGSLENYFLGGRTLPWWLLGSSGMSAWFDVTGTMIITSFLYMMGPRGLFIEFRGGACLILAFLLCYTGKWHRRSGCMTGAEWMIFRFGRGKDAEAARLLVALTTQLLTIGMIAYLVRGMGLFLSYFFPYPPSLCALALIVIAVSYTMFSGFYGVVITDLMQTVIVFISALVLSVAAFIVIPDNAALNEIAREVTTVDRWINSFPTWQVNMPRGYEQYELLMVFAMFYLLRNIIGGLGSGPDPKYFAARSDREAGLLSLLISMLIMIRWPMMMGLAVLGLMLVQNTYPDPAVIQHAAEVIKLHFPEVTHSSWHDLSATLVNGTNARMAEIGPELARILGEDWTSKLPLVSFHGTVDPERILPAVIATWVPLGLKGLVLVSCIAASMSTFDSTLNSSAGFFVRDIYQRWLRPAAHNRELIYASYAVTAGLAALGYALGVGVRNINDIWGWIIMGIGTGLVVPNVLRLYWWRMNGWGVAFGLAVGGTAAVFQRIIYPDMDERLQFAIMLTLPLAATIAGCFLTRPTPNDTLVAFYRKTRPWGVWGPVARQVPAEEQRSIVRENTNDLIALPFALVYQVTLFMLPMQAIIHSWRQFWLTLPVFAVGSFGLYWFWYRNLLRHEQGPVESFQGNEPEIPGAN